MRTLETDEVVVGGVDGDGGDGAGRLRLSIEGRGENIERMVQEYLLIFFINLPEVCRSVSFLLMLSLRPAGLGRYVKFFPFG